MLEDMSIEKKKKGEDIILTMSHVDLWTRLKFAMNEVLRHGYGFLG